MALPLIIAGIAALAILFIFFGLAGSRPVDPVQARLTQLGSMQARTLEELELQQPFFERTVRPLALRLSGAVQRVTSPRETSRTERRLAQAGNPADLKTTDFLGLKAVAAIVAAIIAFVLLGLLGNNAVFGVLMALVGAVVGYLLPEFWLGRRIKARRKAILLAIPDTLDLLTISVRAGLGFDAALANFIGAIIQAEQLGVSISKVLQVQSEQLRIERRQRAEEMAAKAPIKMLFPLVGCIFPSLFIVILGPAVILIVVNIGKAQ